MQYLLGFDCGATKIEYKLADAKGNTLLHSKNITPANLLVNGADSISGAIGRIIEDIISSELIDMNQLEFVTIVIGAAGAGRKNDAESLKSALFQILNQRSISYKKIHVISDAQIALEASFPGKPGCILIAGTGSILYGKDANGNIHRAGGFGRLIGDEGSAYSIGSKAIKIVARDFDRGISNSPAVKLFADNYSIKSIDELLAELYRNNFDIASVAKHVIAFALQGADFAINILDEESDELILLIKTLMNKMKIEETEISFTGGLIANKNYYSDMLRNKIETLLKTVTVSDKNSNPVDGAIYLAKELVDV
jgi:N-acetylglucosamine kinase-like BadF-type ATPase